MNEAYDCIDIYEEAYSASVSAGFRRALFLLGLNVAAIASSYMYMNTGDNDAITIAGLACMYVALGNTIYQCLVDSHPHSPESASDRAYMAVLDKYRTIDTLVTEESQ